MANLGDRVVGEWGAMHPQWEGTIVGLLETGEIQVVWDDWCDCAPVPQRYRLMTEPSPNGSGVGVWLESQLRGRKPPVPQEIRYPVAEAVFVILDALAEEIARQREDDSAALKD